MHEAFCQLLKFGYVYLSVSPFVLRLTQDQNTKHLCERNFILNM